MVRSSLLILVQMIILQRRIKAWTTELYVPNSTEICSGLNFLVLDGLVGAVR
jgi:hypothetical protein